MNRSTSSRAFTLIELLVVVAIIAALIAILLPSLNRAKAAAQIAVCSANFHSKHLAFYTYAIDHKGALPSFVTTGTWATYATGIQTPKTLIAYGLKTNNPDKPAEISGYYTDYKGIRDSVWNCPSVEQNLQFYDSGGGVVGFNTYPSTNVLTGLAGQSVYLGANSPAKLHDRTGPILAETVRSDTVGQPAMPTAHPGGLAVHAFLDGYVAAIDYKQFSYLNGVPSPRLNQWNFGPNLWHWFWAEKQ